MVRGRQRRHGASAAELGLDIQRDASATCCFWVRVSNAGGHADSATAAITVGTGATTSGPGVGTNFGGSSGGDAFLYNPPRGVVDAAVERR